ncbi:MAG: ECF transporter S component [Ruminococcaceae bacterium]|nr:ECF transporter S component [Oscillospiraceae bacterium]
MKNQNLKKITLAAVFTAIAFLFTFVFKFKVSFLTFDFKDAIIAVISLMNGPIYGIFSALTVALLEFLSISDTGFYGLIMNFISSGSFALIFGLIYKLKKSFSGAIVAAVSSVIGVTAIMMIANYFITPFYMGVGKQDVLNLIPSLLLPFNLAKSIINTALTLIIYKPVINILRKAKAIETNMSTEYKFSVKSLLLLIVSLVIIILTVLFILFFLDGGFELFG